MKLDTPAPHLQETNVPGTRAASGWRCYEGGVRHEGGVRRLQLEEDGQLLETLRGLARDVNSAEGLVQLAQRRPLFIRSFDRDEPGAVTNASKGSKGSLIVETPPRFRYLLGYIVATTRATTRATPSVRPGYARSRTQTHANAHKRRTGTISQGTMRV